MIDLFGFGTSDRQLFAVWIPSRSALLLSSFQCGLRKSHNVTILNFVVGRMFCKTVTAWSKCVVDCHKKRGVRVM